MIFKIFLPKNFAKKLAFLTQNKAKLFKSLTITLVFEKNANFFAEICQKSQKIVIITSTPDEFVKKVAKNKAQPIFCQK
jgi:phosphoserine phosphatase